HELTGPEQRVAAAGVRLVRPGDRGRAPRLIPPPLGIHGFELRRELTRASRVAQSRRGSGRVASDELGEDALWHRIGVGRVPGHPRRTRSPSTDAMACGKRTLPPEIRMVSTADGGTSATTTVCWATNRSESSRASALYSARFCNRTRNSAPGTRCWLRMKSSR